MFGAIAILSGMKSKGTICLMSLGLLVLMAADPKPDSFQAKTVWQGVSDADPRWAHTKEFPVRLRVMERNGEDFAAIIAFQKPGDLHVARLEGKIRNGDLIARECLISTGRQNGKSIIVRVIIGWLLDEGRGLRRSRAGRTSWQQRTTRSRRA